MISKDIMISKDVWKKINKSINKKKEWDRENPNGGVFFSDIMAEEENDRFLFIWNDYRCQIWIDKKKDIIEIEDRLYVRESVFHYLKIDKESIKWKREKNEHKHGVFYIGLISTVDVLINKARFLLSINHKNLKGTIDKILNELKDFQNVFEHADISDTIKEIQDKMNKL